MPPASLAPNLSSTLARARGGSLALSEDDMSDLLAWRWASWKACKHHVRQMRLYPEARPQWDCLAQERAMHERRARKCLREYLDACEALNPKRKPA